MSVAEIKNTIINLVEKERDEKKLQALLNILVKHEQRDISAEEAFEKISARYSETLRRLAQ